MEKLGGQWQGNSSSCSSSFTTREFDISIFMKLSKGCLSFVPVPAIFEFGSWEQAVGARWEE
jgi:hypothetical protein